MKYPTHNFARTDAPVGTVDLIHTGSIFNDYRWSSPPPEYPVGNSDYASPGHITQYPNDFAYVPHPYPAYRPRTLSNASFMEAWTQPAAPRSPASAASTQPFYWLDVDRADQSHTSFSGNSGVASYATSDTSIYNYATEHQQMHPSSYFSTSTTASYRSFDDLDTEEYRLLFPPQPLGIPSIDPRQMIEHLDKYWQAFHPHFPIKHRPTFVFNAEKPLCLAAMVAIGAQYSGVVGARAESRMLHEKCLKALAKVPYPADVISSHTTLTDAARTRGPANDRSHLRHASHLSYRASLPIPRQTRIEQPLRYFPRHVPQCKCFGPHIQHLQENQACFPTNGGLLVILKVLC